MIGYTTVGTNNLQAATDFYQQLIGGPDVRLLEPNDRVRLWMKKGAPMFGIAVPFDGEAATVGNGTMIALSVADPDEVRAVHARALQLGGTNEGDPGPRGNTGFFGGYCRDLDGNKLAVFCIVRDKR